MKITLAVCTNRQIRPKTVQSLLELVNHNKDHELHILICEHGYTIAENRNYAAVQAQMAKSDYLFFCDDDMTFPPDTLDRLLSHKKEIVGVASNSRMLPLAPTVGLMDEEGKYVKWDTLPKWKQKLPEQLFEAYTVGTGIMLIDMKVFDEIDQPWFHFKVMKNGRIHTGEDAFFCGQAKAKGYKIWCDPTIKVGHLGEYEF